MQTTDYERFEKYWKDFSDRLQGQMMTQANKGVFTFASLNLILSDCVGSWDSKYSGGGRWLDEYEKKYPQKAQMIRNILLNDMKFTEDSEGDTKNDYLKYIVPLGSAAVGLGISRGVGASNLVQAICTISPAVVAYPVTNNILDSTKDQKMKARISNYMRQLDKYRLSIESILKDV